MRSFITKRILTASMALAAAFAVTSPGATAGDYCYNPAPVCHYKTVTVWEYVRKPYVRYVTRYDHCGEAYVAKQISWRVVKVPVTKQVKVCY